MGGPVFQNLQRDLAFILYEVLEVDALFGRERFRQHSRDTVDEMLSAAIRLAAEEFDSHAAQSDANEPYWDGEKVHLIDEIKVALDAYIENGFLAAPFPEELGGLGVPYTVAQAFNAAFYAANPGTSGYPLLTSAAANMLRVFGSEGQKARYLGPMLEGRWFGTMCLSEPDVGSSLADLRCTARPQSDGTYHLVGDKMWISGGEHDLSENIIHMVLAKLPGAPPGTKGISLFIVPKFVVNEDGTLGDRNGVLLTGLNHKMGYRGTVNTALAFGSEKPAIGYLVGEPHQGLRFMFHMMNEARVGVGLGAAMLAYAGFRFSLNYALERPQGRHPDQRDPSSAPVAIIEHADVRRMLLAQKCYAEGALSLGIYCARLIDELESARDDVERNKADELLQILTPIAKAWPSEYGPKANDYAIQILGGYGYTRDFPVERYYRDNRLNPIHEGTNGIQSLDLLGRKVTMNGGSALRTLLGEVGTAVAKHRGSEPLNELCLALEAAVDRVRETTMVLGGAAMNGEVRLFLANSHVYLNMVGHVVIAWMWLEQAATALRLSDGADAETKAFCEGKVQAALFFTRYELPRTEQDAALLKQLDDTTLSMKPEWF